MAYTWQATTVPPAVETTVLRLCYFLVMVVMLLSLSLSIVRVSSGTQRTCLPWLLWLLEWFQLSQVSYIILYVVATCLVLSRLKVSLSLLYRLLWLLVYNGIHAELIAISYCLSHSL